MDKTLIVIQVCILGTMPCHRDKYLHHACVLVFNRFTQLISHALKYEAMPLCHVVLRALAALRNLPIDVLIGGLDVASLAMYAAVIKVSFACHDSECMSQLAKKILTFVR